MAKTIKPRAPRDALNKVITINLSLTTALLEQIDNHADALYASRSEYVRHAVIEQMRLDSQTQDVRRTMSKQLPLKYIVPSKTDEFDISPDYID